MKAIQDLTDDELGHLVREADRLQDAPEPLIRAAIQTWSTRQQPGALQAAAQTALRHLVALLSFDSWAAPQLAPGLRSAAADTRHLLYSSMGRDIDLRVAPDARLFALAGQVLGPDEAGWVELSAQDAASGDAPRRVALDAMGEFRLEGVARGRYLLTLRMGQDVIVLPPIDVGPREH